MKQTVELERGCAKIEAGFSKAVAALENKSTSKPFTAAEYMELYTTIYDLCITKEHGPYGDHLYKKYHEIIASYLSQTVLPSLQVKYQVYLLEDIVHRWANYQVLVRWMARLFDYLERFLIPRKSVTPLRTVGIQCFNSLVYDEMRGRVRDAVLDLIHEERNGKEVHRALLKKTTKFFVAVKEGEKVSYEYDLEQPILEATAAYYAQVASEHVSRDSFSEYMIMAEKRLKDEDDRASSYLLTDTRPKLLEIAGRELLLVHQNQLLEKEESGLVALLRDGKVEDLRRMYRLFHTIDGSLNSIILMLKQHVTDLGLEVIKQAEDDAREKAANKKPSDHFFVKRIIELQDKYLGYVNEAFDNDNGFRKAQMEAFEVFCNREVAGVTTSELLVTFADNLLRKHDEPSGEPIEETFEKIVKILMHIKDKDLFAEFYRKKLAVRLLHDKNSNNEHETCLLSKLKEQNGIQFTSRMEGMVTDMVLSKEIQGQFGKYLKDNPQEKSRAELTINILNTGFWPSFKQDDVNLPDELLSCINAFNNFYKSKTESRRLTWVTSMGTCTMMGMFEGRNVELVVTTYQAATLMLFNGSKKLRLKEIAEQLNLPEDDTVRILHSLSCAKYKLLRKVPSTKSISKNDTFEFNSKFTDKMRRIKVPPPPSDEKRKVMEVVNRDRRYAIDAALVRIMKGRKLLNYQQLVIECIEMLSRSFKPDVKDIKQRVEDLISREFIGRQSEDPNSLNYIA